MALRLEIVSVGLCLSLISTTVWAADVPINEDARAHFSAGVNLLQDPDGARYEEAHREFKAAYAASPSWKILGNLGLSAMKLERDSEAIEAYRKYLAEGGNQVDADERAQFQRDLATLEAGVVRLTLQSEPPGATLEDERFPATGSATRNGYGTLSVPLKVGVRAGRHRFTAKLPGHADAVWEVELSPRQQQAYVFKLVPASAQTGGASASGSPASSPTAAADPKAEAGGGGGTSGLRIGAYVALGVGAVGLGAGTLFALQASGRFKEANELAKTECGAAGDGVLADAAFGRWQTLGNEADRKKTLSLVGFIVGGVGVAAGVTLFVLSSSKKEPQAAQLAPYLGLGSLGVRGSFSL